MSGRILKSVLLQVDRTRLQVFAYHVSMGLPCLIAIGLGCIFAIATHKETVTHGLMSPDLLFIGETYSMDLIGERSHGGRNPFYRWECLFWVYVFVIHVVFIVLITSPLDIFDCTLTVTLFILSIMYLCRPR